MLLNLSWGTQWQIYSGGWGKGRQEKEAQKQREEARREEATHSPDEEVAEKHARTEKSDTEMDTCTEFGGEVSTSQSHSRHKKGHMTNIYLMDSKEETIVDFVKDP